MSENQLFHVGQKAFINKNGKVLVLMDRNMGVDLPGGRIQIGETNFNEALQREVTEETSLEIAIGKPLLTWYLVFGPKSQNAGKKIFVVGYQCDYIAGEVKLSEEHKDFQWVTKEDFHKLDDGSPHFAALKKYFDLF
jgi:8-oxo-dGTP pyrophosphatase MutT (NUDIX family)